METDFINTFGPQFHMKIQGHFLIATLAVSMAACGNISPSRIQEEIGSGTFESVDGQNIHAVYMKNDTVRLTFANGFTKVLTRAVSASGICYVSEGSEWWEHQGEATYSLDGKRMFIGKLR